MRTHTVELTERELRVVLTAFDICRDQTVNHKWTWWTKTQYADKLYNRLLHVGEAVSR